MEANELAQVDSAAPAPAPDLKATTPPSRPSPAGSRPRFHRKASAGFRIPEAANLHRPSEEEIDAIRRESVAGGERLEDNKVPIKIEGLENKNVSEEALVEVPVAVEDVVPKKEPVASIEGEKPVAVEDAVLKKEPVVEEPVVEEPVVEESVVEEPVVEEPVVEEPVVEEPVVEEPVVEESVVEESVVEEPVVEEPVVPKKEPVAVEDVVPKKEPVTAMESEEPVEAKLVDTEAVDSKPKEEEEVETSLVDLD
jgi:hypothetical protein